MRTTLMKLPDEQRRAHERRNGQRDLGDDEHGTNATTAAARAPSTGAFVAG